MPNLNYNRSRAREYFVMHKLALEGFIAFRTAGSHGIADVVGINPIIENCANPDHFQVRLIQIKVSERLKTFKMNTECVETTQGLINVEFWHFPVKSAKYYKRFNKKK